MRGDDKADVVPHEAAPNLEVAEAHTRRLGQVLIEAGLITEDELAEALAEQTHTGRLLGEILIARRLVSSPILAQALAVQAGTELVVEQGFGAGLWARIEQQHPSRRITVVSSSPEEGHEHEADSHDGFATASTGEDESGYFSVDALLKRIVQLEHEADNSRLRLDELSKRLEAVEAPAEKTAPRRAPAKSATAARKAPPKRRTPAKPKAKTPSARSRRPPAS